MQDLLGELKENGYYSTECQLFESYVYLIKGEKEEARRLLDALENNQKVHQEEELEGAFLYLNEYSQRSTQSRENTISRLYQLYQRRVDSELLLYMIFQMDGEHGESRQGKCSFWKNSTAQDAVVRFCILWHAN